MNTPVGFEQCLTFINCQLQPVSRPVTFGSDIAPRCAITISRQCGSGGHEIAQKLAARLRASASPEAPPWTVFDRNLVERVLQDHNLPERLARFMPEDRTRQIEAILHEIFGLLPPAWTLVQQTAETILQLAELGNVIILGRGANIITASLPHMIHVRVMGSLERRIDRLCMAEGITRKEAAYRIRREDLGRRRYVRQNFHKDVNDPLLYHLVINTDLVSPDEAVDIIADMVHRRVPERQPAYA
ncbi:MAG TPA: cytidylate kinase-like family protein [Verrucomicrobia bacterium]|nr:cytidylate kinase-like family protein [Verrucomicrobiota bacterium]HOB32156.1 cytidylate kinase-like family protein [Verrucomicrobiota bacterium]HOP98084.1 cytidylate kinase-like family protein [Verrucomicrobiota bacterium]HPU55315.1 cytidylate kinase-like family protein [Verrucomicrobiota bacterium]